MKRILFLSIVLLVFSSISWAQDNFTEGSVWACSMYRTKQGHTDDYLKYLRENYIPTSSAATKQGLNLGSKVYVKTASNPADWDVAICTLFASYGDALDFDPENDKKSKAIQAAHWKTADEAKQREMSEKRFAYRDFVGSDYFREVTLRPMP